MSEISFDRILNAAMRGCVVFKNKDGGVSTSKNINDVFLRAPNKVIGVYDDHVKEEWLYDDLVYSGFTPV